jgi:hypothetical protein
MKLVSNWQAVLTHAWSVRLIILAGLLSAAEVGMPYIENFIVIPEGMLPALTAIVSGAALIARLMAQRKVSGNAESDS